VGDTSSTNEDTAVTIDVLGNDSDPDTSDTLSIAGFTQGANGGLVTLSGNSLIYDPNGQFDSLLLDENATDTFTYTLIDNNGLSATTTVVVTISGVSEGNQDPQSGDDSFQTTEDTSLVITAVDLLSNDSDPDVGDVLAITDFTQPTHGTLVDNGDGTWTYLSNQDYNGADSFTYTVSDGQGGSATATVAILVIAVNDAPVASPDNYTTVEGSPLTVAIASLLSNDSDVEGDTLSVLSFGDPASGTVQNNGDGTWTYTPEPGFIGEDTFTYVATDGSLSSDPVTVTVTVTPAVTGTMTYTMDQSVAIADNGFIVSTINVVDSFTILDLNVVLDIDHTRDSDLRVVLVSPNGTPIELFRAVGGRGDGFIGTVLDDDGSTAIGDGSAPFTGVYRPTGDLSALEGLNVQGTWTLEVYDTKKRARGTLNSWSIVVERGSSLVAAEAPAQTGAIQPGLTREALMIAVDEGIQRWSEAGILDADNLLALNAAEFRIADLDGLALGFTTAETITIDVDAAGWGWFIDETPVDDSEFEDVNNDGIMVATEDSHASGCMDLLTVVMHEIGHFIGLDHDTPGSPVMNDSLDAGTRLSVSSPVYKIYLDGEEDEEFFSPVPLTTGLIYRYQLHDFKKGQEEVIALTFAYVISI
jgi:subtilisin-like proprotein convertase family protein